MVPEFGSAPPPAPPPASDEPLVPLVSVPELSPPVADAWLLPDVDVMLEPEDEVGEDIMLLELMALAPLIILLELIMDEEAIAAMEDAVAIAPDAVDEAMAAVPVGALVSRLATPLGPDSPFAAPPIPP